MSAAAGKQKMDDSAESAPQNWVVPEVMKPEEKELVEKLTQVMSKNTFHRAKEATRLARSSDAARNEARQAAAEAEAIAAEAASPRPKKKSGFLCCGSSDLCGNQNFTARSSDVQEQPSTRPPSPAQPQLPVVQPEDPSGVLRDPASGVTYSIEKVIGEGGFSRVLLVKPKEGHDPTQERNGRTIFAAKIIPKAHLKLAGESFIKATMLERDLLADVQHPFLLGLYHSFQEKDRLVMVVDFCQGGSVHYHVNVAVKSTGRGLPEDRAAFYVAEIALGLAALHSVGIVHRDLKLENVLVKRNGHLAICDFGTSKTLLRTDDDGAPPMPQRTPNKLPLGKLEPFTRSIIGTPAYMAPEMLLEQPYNYSVDWWALGVTYFTMLRARLPFDGGRNHEEEKMLWRIVKSRPRYDQHWRPATRECLQLLLQKVPKTRICSLSRLQEQSIFSDIDWKALECEQAQPPFVPQLSSDDDVRYIPSKYKEAPLPRREDSLRAYKQGDSMKQLMRGFSHRGSFHKSSATTDSVDAREDDEEGR